MKKLYIKLAEFFKMIDSMFESIGFESMSEFIKESLFFSSKYMNIYLFGFTVSGILSVMKAYIVKITTLGDYMNLNVYNPSKAIILLFIITIADIWFGTTKARAERIVTGIKDPEMINGSKIIRAFSRFSVQVFFVSFLFNVSNLYGTLNVEWVVHALMIAFIVGTFISAWNNAYIIGWLDKEVHGFILSIFDLRRIFTRMNRASQTRYNDEHEDEQKPDSVRGKRNIKKQ